MFRDRLPLGPTSPEGITHSKLWFEICRQPRCLSAVECTEQKNPGPCLIASQLKTKNKAFVAQRQRKQISTTWRLQTPVWQANSR
jgi:hypothetical protein